MSEVSDRVDQLRDLGRLDAAEREARAALAAAPDDPELLGSLGFVLFLAERFDEGLAAARTVLATSPDDGVAQIVAAHCASGLGMHDEAIDATGILVSQWPEQATFAGMHALVLMRGGRHQDALAEARRAVILDPRDADAHYVLGEIHTVMGNKPGARTAYQDVLSLEPDHALAHHNLAWAQSLVLNPKRALRRLIDAGALDPSIPTLPHNLREILWAASVWVRIWLVVASLAVLWFRSSSGWTERYLAASVLLVTALGGWWTTRDLSTQTRATLRAATRGQWLLALTWAVIACCLLVFAAIAVTGDAAPAALVWTTVFCVSLIVFLVRKLWGVKPSGEPRTNTQR